MKGAGVILTFSDGTFARWPPEEEEPTTLGGPGSGNWGHTGTPGRGGSPPKGSGGSTEGTNRGFNVTPAELERDKQQFFALRDEWGRLNNELLNHVGNPDDPEAVRLHHEMKDISKRMYRLEADSGGLEGIGLPGGPRDVVIVGAGPGGMSAAIMCGTDGLDTLLVDANLEPGGQSRFSSRIENYPGFPIGESGETLANDMFQQTKRVGADTMLGVRVTGLTKDPETGLKHLTLSNGETVITRSVIIAGGVELRTLPVEGADLKGVTFDGRTLARDTVGQTAVVVGGSNGAAQAALAASVRSEHVVIVARGAIDAGMSDYQRLQIRNLEKQGKMTVLEGDEIARIMGTGGRVSGIVTKGGKEFKAAGVGTFIGGGSDTKWLPESLTRSTEPGRNRGKIVTDVNYQTSIPGVFAVGDIRKGYAGRIGAAVGEGQIAQRNVFLYFEKLKAEAAAKKKKDMAPAKGTDPFRGMEERVQQRKRLDRREWSLLVDRLFALSLKEPFLSDMIEEEDALKALGGPGSGNWGHGGTPGRGGSPPKGSGTSTFDDLSLRKQQQKTEEEYRQFMKEAGLAHTEAFFHGTSSQAIDSIKQNGLVPAGGKGADAWALENMFMVPQSMLDRPASVYLTPKKADAERFAQYAAKMNPGSSAVVLQIDVPDGEVANLLRDEHMTRALRSLDRIPPSWISGKVTERGIEALAAKGATIYAVVLVDNQEVKTLGGPGSGNWGHKGTPGRGGSPPKGGGGSASKREGQAPWSSEDAAKGFPKGVRGQVLSEAQFDKAAPKGLTEGQAEELLRYVSPEHYRINDSLRSDEPDADSLGIAKVFDEVATPLPKGTILYRGLALDPDTAPMIDGWQVGQEVQMKGLVSTSIDPLVALSFAGDTLKSQEHDGVILEIKPKRGVALSDKLNKYLPGGGKDEDAFIFDGSEGEVVLRHNSRYRVVGRLEGVKMKSREASIWYPDEGTKVVTIGGGSYRVIQLEEQ